VAELVARVEALLRRSGKGVRATLAPFSVGDWRVDPETLRAEKDGASVVLSRTEAELLALLHREIGRIVSRRTLLHEIWGFESPERVETRTVDVHVSNLRKRLGEDGHRLIETVRGEGYRLVG
jgi:DNA-binding response OmpR family regulator